MRILNMAHGSFYALGAYTAASLVGWYFTKGYPPWGSFLLLFAAAIVAGTLFGLLIERGLLRFMYGRDEVVMILVTYGVLLILEDVIKLIWGVGVLRGFPALRTARKDQGRAADVRQLRPRADRRLRRGDRARFPGGCSIERKQGKLLRVGDPRPRDRRRPRHQRDAGLHRDLRASAAVLGRARRGADGPGPFGRARASAWK